MGGCCTATLDPLLQVLHGDFRNFFVIIMCVIGKDPRISKRIFQNIIKVANYQTFSKVAVFKPLKKRFIEIVVWVFDLKTAGPIVLSILARFSLHWFYCIFIQGVRNQSARIWVLSVLTIPCQIPQTETRLDALLHVDTSSRSNR